MIHISEFLKETGEAIEKIDPSPNVARFPIKKDFDYGGPDYGFCDFINMCLNPYLESGWKIWKGSAPFNEIKKNDLFDFILIDQAENLIIYHKKSLIYSSFFFNFKKIQ